MYRYDEFDAAVVRDRVAQFREQVARRLDGSLTEEEFTPLRLMNGLYLQLHAYMLRIAVPYGTLNARQLRQLAMIADTWDRGYGHFTTRQNLQLNWPKLQRRAGYSRRAGRGRDALHPDLGKLHPQRHRRPFRRRRRRRGGGSAPDRGADPAMVDPAPGVQLPAAQVQDRGDRRRARPGGGGGPRYRPPPRPERGGRDRLQGAGRRRARADADDRQGDPRLPAAGRAARLSRGDHAGLQSRGTARQQVQGADQDPRPRDRHRRLHRAGRGGVCEAGRAERQCRSGRGRADRGLFRAAGLRDAAGGLARASRRRRRAIPISRASPPPISSRTRCRATPRSPSR